MHQTCVQLVNSTPVCRDIPPKCAAAVDAAQIEVEAVAPPTSLDMNMDDGRDGEPVGEAKLADNEDDADVIWRGKPLLGWKRWLCCMYPVRTLPPPECDCFARLASRMFLFFVSDST